MHVVIMGCGRVGSTLARNLEDRGHSVSVIDQHESAFRRLPREFRGRQVAGLGYDRDTLIEAGVESADAFAAVSSGDNSNVISARVVRETFGVERVAARIYDPKRAEVYERLGIPTIATVRWTADRILHALVNEGPKAVWTDPTSSVSIVEIPVHDGWVGQPFTELEAQTGCRVACVTRFGRAMLPAASTVVQDDDQVFVLVTEDAVGQVVAISSAPPEGGH